MYDDFCREGNDVDVDCDAMCVLVGWSYRVRRSNWLVMHV